MELNLAFNGFHQQTIHGAPTGGNVLEYVSALLLFFDCFTNALQLPLNAIHADEKLFLLLDGMSHACSEGIYALAMTNILY